MAAGVVALLYLLAHLRVVVLPVIVALLATTLLLPLKRRLTRLRVPNGLASGLSLLLAFLVLAGIGTAIAPSIGSQVDDLGAGVRDGARKAARIVANEPFNLSRADINERVDAAIDGLRKHSGSITRGVTSGAVVLGEVLTGLIVTLLLTFFFLKDGPELWAWLMDLLARRHRREADEVGARVFTALAGYVRGIALVGLADALLIGIGLLILGVPLVLPLMVLTFLAAFLPLVGAFLAGLAAVLIALVSQGFVTAVIVLGLIVLVQQVEGHVLYPLLMSRTVKLHPAVIVLALAVGAVLGGIVGVFLAVPVAGVASTLIDYFRGGGGPDSPVADHDPGTGTGSAPAPAPARS